jgi:hypothetical protein
MALTPTFGFFSDAALTLPITTLPFIAIPGVTTSVDADFFFGSPAAGRSAINRNDPANQLVATFLDTDLGQGVDATDFVLANSLIGLDSSIVQALDLGLEVLSGTVNAVNIFVRYTPPLGFEGNDIALQISLPDGFEQVL